MASYFDGVLGVRNYGDRLGTRLSHAPGRAVYDIAVSAIHALDASSNIHVVKVAPPSPLSLYLPNLIESGVTDGRFFILYVTGTSGGVLRLYTSLVGADVGVSKINNLAVGSYQSYTLGSEAFVLFLVSVGANYYCGMVNFNGGGGGGGGSSTIVAAGSGIGVIQAGSTYTVSNTAPNQVVFLSGGTGISVGGSYPSFTVTNSSPDQVVALTAGSGITVGGTYPNFTITNAAPNQTVSITSGSSSLVVGGSYPAFTLTSTALSASYINASQTIASAALTAATEYSITSAFTANYNSSEWSVNGSGGLVYNATAKGRALYFSYSSKHTSATAGYTLTIKIRKNADKYLVYSAAMSGAYTNFGSSPTYEMTTTVPIICEPGDVFYIGLVSDNTSTITGMISTFNIAGVVAT